MSHIPFGSLFIEQYINSMNVNTLVKIHGLYNCVTTLHNVTTYPMLRDNLPHTGGNLSLVMP